MASPTQKQLEKLREIGSVPEGKYFALPLTIIPLTKAGWVEIHPTAVNPKDKKQKAARLTAAGRALIAPPGTQSTQPTGSQPTGTSGPASFKIVSMEKPAQTRNLNAANYKYPFDQLGHGQAFFVPANPDNQTNPSKAFASTLATANRRWNTKDDFRHFSSRSMLGDPFGDEFKGVKGVGIFRDTAEEEADAKKAFFEE